MKYYPSREEEAKDYILNYTIKNDKIIIKYANRNVSEIPYSKTEEDRILSKMERQANRAEIKEPSTSILLSAVMQPLAFHRIVEYLMRKNGSIKESTFALLTIIATLYPAYLASYITKKSDIEKMNFFLEHKEELNEYIKNSESLPRWTSQKAINEIRKQLQDNREPITINNINNYTKEDMVEMVNRIFFEKMYARAVENSGNEYNIYQTEESSPTLKRTIDNTQK